MQHAFLNLYCAAVRFMTRLKEESDMDLACQEAMSLRKDCPAFLQQQVQGIIDTQQNLLLAAERITKEVWGEVVITVFLYKVLE